MSCCDAKPVSLNHLNKGTRHLADDVSIPNNEAIPASAVTASYRTVTTGRSTRDAADVVTVTTVVSG